jgi:transposase-like protein
MFAMDRDSLQLLLAQGLSVQRIAERFGKNPSTVSYWLDRHGLEAINREVHAAKGGIEEERLTRLIECGMTIREIGLTVGLSKSTVRHWMRRYGLRTRNAVGRRPEEVARAAKEAGFLTAVMVCRRHGETDFVLEGRGYYRCKRCRADGVTRRRRKLKEILVREAGGRCSLCGYSRSLRALEFHHVDPREKRLQLSANGVTLSLDVLRAESLKCVLLCSNCHAEVEDGALPLPVEFRNGSTGPETP